MLEPRDATEEKIIEFYEENLASLLLEGGHALSPEGRVTARNQALLYWRKLRELAEHITDTEVKLSLPLQKTPQGRTFAIEGIVDIVREEDRTVMYDVKTHDPEYVRSNKADYEKQLNVYAHIWQNLRGQPLDQTAIICTAYPDSMRGLLDNNDEARMEHELERWNPLVDIPFSTEHVQQTIRDFGTVVDQIENGEFSPAPLSKLLDRLPGVRQIFAVYACRNCDARFSCSSYRQYARGSKSGAESRFRKYLDDFGDEEERAERMAAVLTDSND